MRRNLSRCLVSNIVQIYKKKLQAPKMMDESYYHKQIIVDVVEI